MEVWIERVKENLKKIGDLEKVEKDHQKNHFEVIKSPWYWKLADGNQQ